LGHPAPMAKESHKLYADTGNIITRKVPVPVDLAALAEELREFRLDRDLTYVQLSALTLVSKSVLQRIEKDPKISLNARTVRKIQRFLEAAHAAKLQ